MGDLIMTSLITGKTITLGDEVDRLRADRREGVPTVGKGQVELDAGDKAGE